jgi:hypothetical protein
LRDRGCLIGRIGKRSVGAKDYLGDEDPPQDLLSPSSLVGNLSSVAINARERLARARHGDLGGSLRLLSSMPLRSGRPEALFGGARKTTRGSSSAIYAGERDRSLSGIERSTGERTGKRERGISQCTGIGVEVYLL